MQIILHIEIVVNKLSYIENLVKFGWEMSYSYFNKTALRPNNEGAIRVKFFLNIM